MKGSCILSGGLIAAACVVLLVGGAIGAQQTITHVYDALGRLTSVAYDNSWTVTYSYDPSGNIVSIVSAPEAAGVEDEVGSTLPRTFALGQGRPSPLTTGTSLAFQLPTDSVVDLSVYDVSGRRVRSLVLGPQPAGYHDARWDGRDNAGRRVASGIYLYRLVAGDFVDSRRIVVLQ